MPSPFENLKKALTRRIKAPLVTTFEFDNEEGWSGSGSFKYKEWHSPDGRRVIVKTIYGGPEPPKFFL